MTLRRRTVITKFVLLPLVVLLCIPKLNGVKASQQGDDALALTVTVMDDEGRFISGLQQGDFSVVINNLPQPVVSFRKSVGPLSVGILFDASGSVLGSSSKLGSIRNRQLITGVGRFLELGNTSNEYFVLGFSTTAQLLLDWTADYQSVLEKLGAIEPKGQTGLYDACYAGIQKVMQGHYPRRIIILISDGIDNRSNHKFTQVRDLLKNCDVLLYSVGIKSDLDYSDLAYEGQGILEELSYMSGGKAFFPRIDDLKSAQANQLFELIANELSMQYSVVVTPEKSSQGKKWRSIKVKVAPQADSSGRKKRLIARTRQGYFQN